MKYSKSDVQSKVHALPELKFENQTLTSFAGLVIFQKFFATIELKKRLRNCFAHLNKSKIFNRTTLFMQLIVHLLLGFRELKDCRYYRDDPMVKRLLGLKRIPDVATLSRFLKEATAQSTNHLRRCLREMVLMRLRLIAPPRLTLDFDGSVQSTQRWAEGLAVGFNKKKKGARSYYPLFCTIAQTLQVLDLDFLHRPGNVHDSNGARTKVIITNKTLGPKRVAAYHQGRGSQEGIFAELKSHCHQDYIPVRTLHGNQTYLLAGLFAYNLVRELQMQTTKPLRCTTAKRASLWIFERVDNLRKTLIHRAGRLTRPQGTLTLSISANNWIKRRLLNVLDAIPASG